MTKIKKLSESELIIMKYIWDEQELGNCGKSSSEIQANTLTTLAKQTIHTMLVRITDKGILRSEGTRNQTIYFPAMTRREYIARIADEVLPGAGDKVLSVL